MMEIVILSTDIGTIYRTSFSAKSVQLSNIFLPESIIFSVNREQITRTKAGIIRLAAEVTDSPHHVLIRESNFCQLRSENCSEITKSSPLPLFILKISFCPTWYSENLGQEILQSPGKYSMLEQFVILFLQWQAEQGRRPERDKYIILAPINTDILNIVLMCFNA